MSFPKRCLLTIFLLALACSCALAGPRDAAWKQVDDAVNKGLPQTAIGLLDPIIQQASEAKAFPEAIKAIAKKISLEGQIQGEKPEEKITRLQAELATVPAEMQPVMEAILANWYWEYFQQNRWRFMQRTTTQQAPGNDFQTWDLPRLFTELDKHLQNSLAAKELLQKTPIQDYDELLAKGDIPDSYRPTLYDFVVHNAIAVYSAAEQAALRPEGVFEVDAEGQIFADATAFLQWQPDTANADSPKLRVIKLLQDLLRFHQNDADKSAWFDADLTRYVYAKNIAFGETKNSRFIASMKRMVEQCGTHALSSKARYHWAEALNADDKALEAHRIATVGKNAHPESVGGKLCHNLIQQIESKSASIAIERVWHDPLPEINVTYRNVNKVYVRVVKVNYNERLKSLSRNPEYLEYSRGRNRSVGLTVQQLAKRPSVRSWSHDLPVTDDFRQRVEGIPAPKDLAPGFYVLLASHDPEFANTKNQLSYAPFWVSKLAIITRTDYRKGTLSGFVLNGNSGEPIANAGIQLYRYQQKPGGWVPSTKTTTNANGLYEFRHTDKKAGRNSYLVLASHEGHQIATRRGQNFYKNKFEDPTFESTALFTDRSLYRPGQTIQFKGICYRSDQKKDDYKTIAAGRALTVALRDVNGKDVETLQVKTNDYGSFNGSFTAPRNRLMGRMSIYVTDGPRGVAAVQVEEYKRPKFEVKVEAPTEAAKLGQSVSMIGKATAYTGAAVDGAKVKWRVVRETRYPIWWHWRCWWIPPRPQSSQPIAHGVATTDVDGTFKVEFNAVPDPVANESDEPTFRYTVYADVTDTAGETRSSSRTINVGFTALKATLTGEDWLTVDNPIELKINTATLDGEPLAATGTLKVYSVKQPKTITRPRLSGGYPGWRYGRGNIEPKPDPTNSNSWPLGDVVEEHNFTTDAAGKGLFSTKLPTGIYRATLETTDRFGKQVTAVLPFHVLAPNDDKLQLKLADLFEASKWQAEPGDEFQALCGSGYDESRAYVEIEHRQKMLAAYWTKPGETQTLIKQKVTSRMRGGFTVRVTRVKENRAYIHSQKVDVPWSNKELTVSWERVVSKLEPGQKETWTAIVKGKNANAAAAEMVATLYDASLDAYHPHRWMQTLNNAFRQDRATLQSVFENEQRNLQAFVNDWSPSLLNVPQRYRSLPPEFGPAGQFGYRGGGYGGFGGGMGGGGGLGFRMAAPMSLSKSSRSDLFFADATVMESAVADGAGYGGGGYGGGGGGEPPVAESGTTPDLSNVSARKNLQETAFFFPHLVSEKEGEVRLAFTMPEALTRWKFFGFAHDKAMRSGFLTDSVVTSKELMIQPNPPRFLREGDTLAFTVRVTNQSAARQTGVVRLSFADARTAESVDELLGNQKTDLSFDVPAQESRSYSWTLHVPDNLNVLTYKAVASSGRLSDGEEGYLPVLSRRVLVIESLPLPIRRPIKKDFELTKLLESAKSDSLQHQSLTVQMTSNPSWYAVMALPYLMEYPHECSEQTFNRLYANSLAQHIANGDPKIRRIFDQWKGTAALDSPLEKNEDLKSLMLEESPWLRQGEAESQARRNVGILFDTNRLTQEQARAMQKLVDMQNADGLWPWFPGGRGNEYISLYITTGYGRLRHLGVPVDVAPAIRSLTALDAWVDRTYHAIKDKEKNHLTNTIALYLYARSFFQKDRPIAPEHQDAFNYFVGQAKKFWLQLGDRQSQAHIAVALHRLADRAAAQGIMRSLKERSVTDDELGMFWRDTELSWWWFRAPIESQAMMIEAFDEVVGDAEAVEACRVWLLKQKQTQDWKTTKATADAIYGLLLRGKDILASNNLVEVSLAGTKIEPGRDIEAGTGFYEKRFVGPEVQAAMGEIQVTKKDTGVAWGSVHWQYLEDIGKVTPHDGTPLKLEKQLFIKETTDRGPVLTPIDGNLKIGDELVVRIILRSDRDMEFVHLKDQRGAGTEPVNVISRYKQQDGLSYYESTRDTATHHFIDYLPKGNYVFEYSLRVQHAGEYQSGLTEIQCMYAPEFNSHSESQLLKVQ